METKTRTQLKGDSHYSLFLIASHSLVALALMAVVIWAYENQRQTEERRADHELAELAELKSKQITSWRQERIGDGRAVGASADIRIATRVLSGQGASASDRADLLDLMNRLATAFGYMDASLVDRNGTPYVELHAGNSEPSRFQDLAATALRGGRVVLSDLYQDKQSHRVLMSMLVPVKDLGAFVFDIDSAQFLYPYVDLRPLRPSARTILVRRDGDLAVYLNNIGGNKGVAVPLRDLFRGMPGASPQVLVTAKPITTVNSAGVPVLLTMRQVPESPWYVMAVIDMAEVNGPLRRLSWGVAALMILIAIANAASGGLIWRSRQRRIATEHERRLRQMSDETPAYLWMTQGTEQNSFINAPFAKFLGVQSDRLGDSWHTYVHPDDAKLALAEFERCLAARCEYEYEFRLRRFDGVYRWMITRGSPRFSDRGEFYGYVGSLVDITERKQAEDQLQSANISLKEEIHERTKTEHEILSLSARLITVQEEERARLAAELHDDFGQQLAALSIATSNLKRDVRSGSANVEDQCERIRLKVVDLAESARRVSHELHPALLERGSLAVALEEYCSEFRALTGLKVHFNAAGSFEDVPSQAGLCVYRVTQEALQNVVKHAHVDRAEVSLSRLDGDISLRVSDAGAGMSEDARSSGGLGLVSMRERARLVNGNLEIESEADHGTTVSLSVPIGRKSCARS